MFLPDKRKPQPTWVYVFACGDHVKIGLAVDVEVRRHNLQSACPLAIATAGAMRFADFMAARAIERELHAEFAEHRGFGEWFALEADKALEALQRREDRSFPVPPPEPPKLKTRAEYLKSMEAIDALTSLEVGYDFHQKRKDFMCLDFGTVYADDPEAPPRT